MNPNVPKSLWDREPRARDLAAWCSDRRMSYAEIQDMIRSTFGDELVPTKTQIYALRSGLARGRWMVPTGEEFTTKAQRHKEEGFTAEAQSTQRESAEDQTDSVAATTEDDRQDAGPTEEAEPHFWDRYPEMRDAALAILNQDYRTIAEELVTRFGREGAAGGSGN